MNKSATPETCKHITIRTWVIAGSDFEEAAGLWSCADCGHKFVPISELMTVESQRDALAEALRESMMACDHILLADARDIRDWRNDVLRMQGKMRALLAELEAKR